MHIHSFSRIVLRLSMIAVILSGGTLWADWNLSVCNDALTTVCPTIYTPAPATVSAQNTGSGVQVTITVGQNFLLWDGGIFGFNWKGATINSATLTASTGTKAPYSMKTTSPSAGNVDGFGSFDYVWDLDTSGVGGASNGPGSLTFTLDTTGNVNDFTTNANGAMFVAHVAYTPNTVVTGYVSNVGAVSVPEPFTLALVGTGLALLGFVRRRTRSNANQ